MAERSHRVGLGTADMTEPYTASTAVDVSGKCIGFLPTGTGAFEFRCIHDNADRTANVISGVPVPLALKQIGSGTAVNGIILFRQG